MSKKLIIPFIWVASFSVYFIINLLYSYLPIEIFGLKIGDEFFEKFNLISKLRKGRFAVVGWTGFLFKELDLFLGLSISSLIFPFIFASALTFWFIFNES